jgi:hypothetical protein
MGPVFQALALSACKDQSLRAELEVAFREHPHDRSSATADWPKRSIVNGSGNSNTDGGDSAPGLQLEMPKMDLLSEIPADCITRMVRPDWLPVIGLTGLQFSFVFSVVFIGLKRWKNCLESSKSRYGGSRSCSQTLQWST